VGKELLKQQYAMHMIWRKIAAKSSLVYERLYNSGLIDDTFGASFQAAPQYAFSVVGGETDQPEKLDETLRTAIKNIQKEQLNTEDVNRMKRYALGNYLASFNSLEYIANSFVSHLFNGTSFLDIPEVINDLMVDDVNQFLIEGLNLEHTAVSLLMPE
jgi:predicted Zn-dependent peptidase